MNWCFTGAVVLTFCVFLALENELHGNAIAAGIGALVLGLICLGWYLGTPTT